MLRSAALVILALLLLPLTSRAQSAAPDADADAPRAVLPLDLPTPNRYRLASGEPGPAYWQQRADYRIDVTLDPALRRITGRAVITYTNNAPTALTQLWLHLDQNYFAPDSRGSRLQPGGSRWRGAFTEGGFDISEVALIRDGTRQPAETLITDTRLRITPAEPMPPGETVDIALDFAFTIPEYGADRMGWLDVERGTVFELAQWYPRMVVYDDVHGWNALPYLGQGEFHLEYGTFELNITVPREMIVAATGTLLNPEEVLTPLQQERLATARQSEATVSIIAPGEVGTLASRPEGDGPLTWRYQAENVRDVAWAASEAFIWDAATFGDGLAMSFYPHEGLGTGTSDGWERSTEYVQHSIRHHSAMWHPYPYPVAINVAGVVGGMEYPMLVFCSVQARDQGLFGVTDHEFAHQWFPMIVGNDERRHAWMDEGLVTFMNYYSNQAFYGDGATRNQRVRGAYIADRMEEAIADQPIATYPDRIPRAGLGFLAYRKPGAGLILLREYVLGPERFDPAFRAFIDRWAYKHPQPADFFRTMENVAGEDLDWFWQGWFYGTGDLDQAITDVTVEDDVTTVTLRHESDLLLPMTVDLRFGDGTTDRRHIPVEAFFTGPEHILLLDRTDLVSAELDPGLLLPDVDRTDNAWQANDATEDGAGQER